MGFSWQLGLMALATGIAGNFQLGYLSSVLSQPYVAIESYMNASWTERSGSEIKSGTLYILMSALNIANPVGQMIGQIVALYICDRIGRKRTALFGCLLIFPGCLMSLAAKYCHPAIELLFIGRIIWSLASGILVVNQTIWIIEAAPARYRGSASSTQEVFSSLGSLTTQAFGVPFSTDELWPLMFVYPMIINVFCIAASFVVHESPHYLLFKRNAPEETRKAIAAYHGTSDEILINAQIEQIKQNGASSADAITKPKVNGMDIMFRPWKANDDVSKVLRHGAWVGHMVKIASLLTATRVFRSFGTYILTDMGGWSYLEARYASLVMAILRIPITMIPVFCIDRVGRRPLLVWTTAVSVICLMLTMISIFCGPSWKIGTLVGMFLFQTANALGLGSLSRFYGAELVPRKLLLKSVSILAIIEAPIRVVPEFIFYPLAHSIGAYFFLIFIIAMIIFLFLMWYYCPETKGKSVNEVLNDIAKRKGSNVTFLVALPANSNANKVAPIGELLPVSPGIEENGKTLDQNVTSVDCKVDAVTRRNIGLLTRNLDLPIMIALSDADSMSVQLRSKILPIIVI